MFNIPQSTSYVVMFKAYLSSDHVSEATGKTIAITISKAGGAFGNPNAGATNATEVSSGWYKFTLDTTDTNTLGGLAYRGAVASIDDVGGVLNVVAATPAVNVTQYGGTNGTFSGGRPEVNVSHFGGSAGTFASGRPEVNVSHFGGTAGTFTVAGLPNVNTTHFGGGAATTASGRPEVNVSHFGGAAGTFSGGLPTVNANVIRTSTAQAGASSTITLDASASATDNLYNGLNITITGGLGAGQTRTITAYVGSTKVATIHPNWTTNPDNTSVFAIHPNSGTNVTTWRASTPNQLSSGRVDASVGAMAADVLTAAATAADFGTEVGTAVWATASRTLTANTNLNDLSAAGVRAAVGLASANLDTQLSTIDDFLDTEVAAIKAKTDSLTFTVAGQVDANIQSINDTTIVGNGVSPKFGV